MKKKIGVFFELFGMLLIFFVAMGVFLNLCLASVIPNRTCTEKKQYCTGSNHDPVCACAGSVDGREWDHSWARGTSAGTTEIGLRRVRCYVLRICQFEELAGKKCLLNPSGKYECSDFGGYTCQSPISLTRTEQCYYLSCDIVGFGE